MNVYKYCWNCTRFKSWKENRDEKLTFRDPCVRCLRFTIFKNLTIPKNFNRK